MRWLQSDEAVYTAGGIVMALSFVVAIAIVYAIPGVTLTRGTLATFSIGFAVSVGVYYVARWIYRSVDEREASSSVSAGDPAESDSCE